MVMVMDVMAFDRHVNLLCGHRKRQKEEGAGMLDGSCHSWLLVGCMDTGYDVYLSARKSREMNLADVQRKILLSFRILAS
jgi:hypothetical protein